VAWGCWVQPAQGAGLPGMARTY